MKSWIARLPILISVPVMIWGLIQALILAPTEKVLGDSQRIFYVHLPCAWAGFLAFLIVAISGAIYLIGGKPRYDHVAQAACEVGVLFTTLVLITGPLWAKNDWGTYWTWDARLTSTLVLWLMYIGYLMLRANALDPVRIKKVLAIYGIVAFLDVPFVYFTITWFRNLHPPPVLGPKGGGLDHDMRVTLFTCLIAFALLLWDFVARRASLLAMESEIAEIRASEVRG